MHFANQLASNFSRLLLLAFPLVSNFLVSPQFKMELCGRPNTNENNSQAEIENETGTSDLVVLSINRILQQAVSSGSSDGTIYKVPEPLRSIKPEAYTPTVISIGPLHSGRKDLMANSLKPRYLQNFLNLTQLPTNTIVEIVKTWEKRARYCYAESIEMSRDEFVELLVFDGCFVVMHLISYSFFELRASDMSNLWKFWDELFCDLILLENQLPFFLLQSLYDLCASSQPFSKGVRFIELVHQYFIESHKGGLFSLKEHVLLAGIGVQVNHFVDLLRLHFTHTRSDKMSFQHTFWPPNATQLHECGVIFKTGKGIAFKDQGGCLQLPQINIYDDFEKRVRNLIAYEQCHFCSELRNEVSNFAVFMQCLVQTDQDVKLLIEGGIIHNNFGSINEVTQLFNNLGKHICPGINSYNSDCKRMKDYCKRPRHRWISLLRRNYFSTPWLCASSIAAILLLALTLIQTIVALVDLLFK